MKCPYRKETRHYKSKSDGSYCYKYDQDLEAFGDCYKQDCPAYTDDQRCEFVRSGKVPEN